MSPGQFAYRYGGMMRSVKDMQARYLRSRGWIELPAMENEIAQEYWSRPGFPAIYITSAVHKQMMEDGVNEEFTKYARTGTFREKE